MRFWTQRLPYLREFARTHRVLHVGPGHEERYGITVDISPEVKPDVLADLGKAPWPFADNSFDAVYAISVIEHLPNLPRVMGELHRVLRPGGFVALLTPHFSDDGSYVDPTHLLHLSARSFDYWIEGTSMRQAYAFDAPAVFRLKERLLMLQRPWIHVPLLQRAANRFVAQYEALACFVVRGQALYVELEAVKPAR